MRYGRFSDDGSEFQIDRVDTPTPWINYLYNASYFSTISQNGGGISYVDNPLHGRITRYRINDVPPDRPGKYIYVRDRDSNALWSLTWQPVGKRSDRYKACHGFGYTRIFSQVEAIDSETLFFVPQEDDCELWQCRLVNRSDRCRRLSLYAYVELCLGHAQIDLINQCDDQHFNRVHFDRDLNCLFATKTYWVTGHAGTQHQENQAWDRWVFFTASEPVTQYETRRERFLGRYRNENRPEALDQGDLSCRDSDYGNAVGVLRVDLKIDSGRTRQVVFSLGVLPKALFHEKKRAAVEKYRSPEAVSRAFNTVRERWDRTFDGLKVSTPDPEFDLFVNRWIPYQAQVAFDVGRVASFYYWGIGRGFGFRDTAQDTLAISGNDPAKARERIILLSRQMFSSGKVLHHFIRDGEGETTDHCDDPFWFILAVTDYIKETGDLALLEESEPFLDQGRATILDRLMAVARRAGTHLGHHGLPIFGRGDWNDTLDYIGGEEGGQSVWGGMFYLAMLNALQALLRFMDKKQESREVADLADSLKASLNQHAWDGAWYLRAIGAGGRKIGSKSCEAGKIFLNPQSWAVISEASDRARLIRCMDSAWKHLDTSFGPKICAPAFREIDPTIGLITRCVPGKKENGAVFCHPVPWFIMAECLLGRGDAAYRCLKKTLPGSIDQDTFCAEPYVYSQYITSDEHEEPGRASHSWQTGTAAWMKKVVSDYLLGIRADYNGLLLDPVIPSHWPRITVERLFRGVRYSIEINNPDGVQSGIAKIEVDGRKIEGQKVLFAPGKNHKVRIVLGK